LGQLFFRVVRIMHDVHFVPFGAAYRSDRIRKIFVVIDDQQVSHGILLIIKKRRHPRPRAGEALRVFPNPANFRS
jgi:hypothetical protein